MHVAVADTHALIWYVFADPRLSVAARAVFDKAVADGDVVLFSSVSFAEMVYLMERGGVPSTALDRIARGCLDDDAVLVEVPVDQRVARAMRWVDRNQVPDFPDRIIAATALDAGLPLISRDRKIRLSTVVTIW